ncbi:MAG: hypothetical protein HY904_25750 [Deltaproteobacteria bacterium]|nr:hypothetical protein [Deltaproteobacteria bacterium]
MSGISSSPRPSFPMQNLPQLRQHLVDKVGDARASAIPCPMLSVLVMEGMLTPDKDGNVQVTQLKEALNKMGLSTPAQLLLAHGGTLAIEGNAFANKLNLFKLYGSTLDHKGSLGPLQDGGFNQKYLDQLMSFSSDGKSLTLSDLSKAESLRMAQEQGGLRDKALGVVEIAALTMVFGTPNAKGEKSLDLKDVVTLFKDNRIPDSFRSHDVGLTGVAWNAAKLAFQLDTTAAGRAQAGLTRALDLPARLDASALKGLGAMCPAGMRPRNGVGISEQEVGTLHRALNPAP